MNTQAVKRPITGKQVDSQWSNSYSSWGDDESGWAEPGVPDADFSSWGQPSQGGSGWGDGDSKSDWLSGDHSENNSESGSDNASQHSGSVISSSSKQGHNDLGQGSNISQSSSSSMQGGNSCWGVKASTSLSWVPNAKYSQGQTMSSVTSDTRSSQGRGNAGSYDQNLPPNIASTGAYTQQNKGWQDLNLSAGVIGCPTSKTSNGWSNIPDGKQANHVLDGDNPSGSQWPSGGGSGWGDSKNTGWGSTSQVASTSDWNKTGVQAWGTPVPQSNNVTKPSQPIPSKSPNTWAQAAGKGLPKTTESTQNAAAIAKAQAIDALINSPDGWGKTPVQQSTSWADVDSLEPDSKTGISMWKAAQAAKSRPPLPVQQLMPQQQQSMPPQLQQQQHLQNGQESSWDRTGRNNSTSSAGSGWGDSDNMQGNIGTSQWRGSTSSWGSQDQHVGPSAASSMSWGASSPTSSNINTSSPDSLGTPLQSAADQVPEKSIVPTGWEEPSPPMRRRNLTGMTDVDDGTAAWGEPGAKQPVQKWNEISSSAPLSQNEMNWQQGPPKPPSATGWGDPPGGKLDNNIAIWGAPGNKGPMPPGHPGHRGSGQRDANQWPKSGLWGDDGTNNAWGGTRKQSSIDGWDPEMSGNNTWGEPDSTIDTWEGDSRGWGKPKPKREEIENLLVNSMNNINLDPSIGDVMPGGNMDKPDMPHSQVRTLKGRGGGDDAFDHMMTSDSPNDLSMPFVPLPHNTPGNQSAKQASLASNNSSLNNMNSIITPALFQKFIQQQQQQHLGRGPPLNPQQNQMLQLQYVQQLRQAMHAGLIQPQLLNQNTLSPQMLSVLQQLLQNQNCLHNLIAQKQIITTNKVLSPNAQRQQLTEVEVKINSMTELIRKQQASLQILIKQHQQASQDWQQQSGQSRFNIWKRPSPDKDDDPFNKSLGPIGKPSATGALLHSHSTPNLQQVPFDNLAATFNIPSMPQGGDNTWSVNSTGSSGWPSSDNTTITSSTSSIDGKESHLSDAGIPEFEPGKPWKGQCSKSIEDDPHITPGTFNSRASLSVASIKESDIIRTHSIAEATPSTDTSFTAPSAWSFTPGSQMNAFKPPNKSWDSAHTPTSITSELWGAPYPPKNIIIPNRPPPGLTGKGNWNQGVGGLQGAHFSRQWSAPPENRSAFTPGSWDRATTWLVLRNLTPQIDGSTLKTLCAQHGPLLTFYLNLNHGNALVRYSSKDEAIKAQRSLNTCVLGNTTILADFANDADIERFFEQPKKSTNNASQMSGEWSGAVNTWTTSTSGGW